MCTYVYNYDWAGLTIFQITIRLHTDLNPDQIQIQILLTSGSGFSKICRLKCLILDTESVKSDS